MAHTNISHRRTHNLLLISKLLSQRDHVSPFTLVCDTLEQTAKPVLREYIRRANLSKTHTIFLGFETTVKPQGVDTYIPCYNKTPNQISQTVSSITATNTGKRVLVLVDSVHPLCTLSLDPRSNLNLTAYLSSFLAPPRTNPSTQISMVTVYHTDIPLPPCSSQSQSYQPSPLTLLSYLATTLLTIHSLSICLSSKIATERSQIPPEFGISEEKSGILIGLKPTKFTNKNHVLKPGEKGVILELEHRRKSGRGVREWYFLPTSSSKTSNNVPVTPTLQSQSQPLKEIVILLDDHPLFRRASNEDPAMASASSDQELAGMTFELGLTDRQRLEREGVVLPYFDAQKGKGLAGPGEGGRILYDMGEEDDFDEDEDEI